MVISRLFRLGLPLILVGCMVASASRFMPVQTHSTSVAPVPHLSVRAELDRHLDADHAGSPETDAQLRALYAAETDTPLWLDAAGRPTVQARQVQTLLAGADQHGLNLEDYVVGDEPDRDPIAFEVGLSRALLRYLGDLQSGQVDASALGFDLPAGTPEDNLGDLLRQAVGNGQAHSLGARVLPAFGNYDGLRRALVDYRALTRTTTLPELPTSWKVVHPGDELPWAPQLRAHLSAVGDMTGKAPALSDDLYTPDLEAGVRRFQFRHGLNTDGVIGQATLAALRVPLSWRVRQLELALERLRWMPRELGGPIVVVNIPMFRLQAFDDAGASEPAMTMRVVVGQAVRNQTPVFSSTIERVVFRPHWNVPRSIIRAEILPAARQDESYLAQHRYELVSADRSIVPASAESLDLLAQGQLFLRQQPGPHNALGLIKFDFPNSRAVYLHDTPSTMAFARDRRDLSHGCVRVEDPVRLAEWILGAENWPRERLIEATQGRDLQPVSVTRPIRVLLFYSTAEVNAEGVVFFASDIYGHDTALDKALGEKDTGKAQGLTAQGTR
jgi:murein L,D-transpeptidase YcbB/YkuD